MTGSKILLTQNFFVLILPASKKRNLSNLNKGQFFVC
jgi:hypothetical protein